MEGLKVCFTRRGSVPLREPVLGVRPQALLDPLLLPVTSMAHKQVDMADIPRHLLPYLDGSRDRAALLDVLLDLQAQDILEITQDDQPIEDAEQIRHILTAEIELRLNQMAQVGLLVG